MKKLLYIFIILLVVGCSYHITRTTNNDNFSTEKLDTIHDTITDTIYKDTVIYVIDSTKIDSLESELVVAKYKLNRIKSYTEIVDRNNSQLKYYKGWIKRVLK